MRRIEAVTGEGALKYINEQVQVVDRLRELLKADTGQLVDMAAQQIAQRKKLEQQLRQAAKAQSRDLIQEMVGAAVEHHGIKVIARRVDDITDMDQLKDLAVDLKHRLKSGVVVLGSGIDKKPQIVVAVTDDLKTKVPAGELVKDIGKVLGGGGGGSPVLATAGGKDLSQLDRALTKVKKLITGYLGESDD